MTRPPLFGGHRASQPPSRARSGAPPAVPPRPQGLMPQIAPGRILSILPLAPGHPVWRLTMKGGFSCVLKSDSLTEQLTKPVQPGSEGESFTDVQMAAYQKAMTDFQTQGAALNAAVMGANLRAISAIGGVMFDGAAHVELSNVEIHALKGFHPKPDNLIEAIKKVEAHASTLMKLKDHGDTLKNLELPSTFVHGKQRSKEEIKADAEKLIVLFDKIRGKTQIWLGMGELVIFDCFIGNTDRFNLFADDLRIRGLGNIFLKTDANGTPVSVIGLDMLDPNSGVAQSMYGTNIERWVEETGKYIRDTNTFDDLGRGIVDGTARAVQSYYRSQLKLDGVFQDFTQGEQSAMTGGMRMGWNKLRDKLATNVRLGNRTPSGVMARAKYLGWIT